MSPRQHHKHHRFELSFEASGCVCLCDVLECSSGFARGSCLRPGVLECFDDILMELEQSIEIHRNCDSHLGGVHFELTGENVTECTGGARGLTDDDLREGYRSLVDPRLNYEQSLEMAMLIARRIGN